MSKYALILLFALLAACDRRPDPRLIEAAARIEAEEPDSALLLLRTIDPEALSRVDDARRRLLLARCFHRSGRPGLTEELLRPAIACFERRGLTEELAAARYYDAVAHYEAGALEEAIDGYTRAALIAEGAPQSPWRGQQLNAIYHTLGSLHIGQGSPSEGEACFVKAIEAAREAGNPEAENYGRFMLASSQGSCGRYDEAIATLAPLVAVRDTLPFRLFAQHVTLQNLQFHTLAQDWSPEQLLDERARIDLREYLSSPLSHGNASSDDTFRKHYDNISATIFYRADALDSARYYIDRSLSGATYDSMNNIDIYRIAAAIYHRQGDDDGAYEYARRYIALRDSLERAQHGSLVAELERKYRTAHTHALREASLRYRIGIATLASLLLSVVIAAAVVGYRRKLRRRDQRISECLALIDSYRTSHDNLVSRLDASDAREAAVKRSLEERFALIRGIAATCYTYGEGDRLVAKMKELALSPAMLADTVRMTDLYNDRAITRLREQLPGWTARNYDFAALVVAGFSPQEISVLLGMTLNGVYTLKSKLKRRIAQSDAADRDRFARYFA